MSMSTRAWTWHPILDGDESSDRIPPSWFRRLLTFQHFASLSLAVMVLRDNDYWSGRSWFGSFHNVQNRNHGLAQLRFRQVDVALFRSSGETVKKQLRIGIMPTGLLQFEWNSMRRRLDQGRGASLTTALALSFRAKPRHLAEHGACHPFAGGFLDSARNDTVAIGMSIQ
jgi:hypothetical protein